MMLCVHSQEKKQETKQRKQETNLDDKTKTKNL